MFESYPAGSCDGHLVTRTHGIVVAIDHLPFAHRANNPVCFCPLMATRTRVTSSLAEETALLFVEVNNPPAYIAVTDLRRESPCLKAWDELPAP